MFATNAPFRQYFDLDGTPLTGGYLYFGVAGGNPETDPVQVYWDSAGTQPAPSKIPTLNGYPVRTGTPANVYVSGDYSITVRNKKGALVYYAANSLDFDVIAQVQALFTRLGVKNSATDGAGLVGFGWDQNYVTGTIGWAAQSGGLTPTMALAVGDGVTDDTAALRNWAASPFPIKGERKTFKVTGTITFTADKLKADFGGMVIDASSGTFTNNAVILVAGGLTQIADLSVSPAAGDVQLTFSSAHNLVEGDVAIIYNPTDSSWSTKQTYYRQGEFFKVAYVSSPFVLKILGGLYTGGTVAGAYTTGYTAANVDVYKMTKNEVQISNLNVIAPNTGTMAGIKIQMATRVRISNVKCSGSDYCGILLDRCYDVGIDGVTVTVPVQAAASKYAISVGNSQHVRISRCHLESVRHAVNIGGDNFTGCVPWRDVWVTNSYLGNDMALSLNPCADMHGNGEYAYYVQCQIKGGGAFGGRNAHYWDCDFLDAVYAGGSVIFGGSEWLGGIAEVKGGSMYGSQSYTFGMVRLSTSTDTNSDSTLIVEGLTVDMPQADTLARCDLAAATYKVNAVVRNITFTRCPNLSNVLRMAGTGAAGDGDYVIVDEIANGKSGATLYTAVSGYGATVKCRLMEQRGTVSITPVAGAATAGSTATYRYSYGSKTPVVSLTLGANTIGTTHAIIPWASSVSATNFGANMQTADNANMGVTSPNVTAYWSASVAEI